MYYFCTIGMSEKLVFKIFYGEGEIIYGPNGVDLSGFPSISKGILRVNERTIQDVRNWMLRRFGLDPERHGLNLQGLVSRVRTGFYWELIDLNGTTIWRKYVEKATERGWPLMILAQAYTKEVVEEEDRYDEEEDMAKNEEENAEDVETNVLTEPIGEADEGERIDHLVEEMRMEDLEHENLAETDSSDEEDTVPVPAEWNNMDFANLAVTEGYSVP